MTIDDDNTDDRIYMNVLNISHTLTYAAEMK